jgi:hypothetical protein
MERLMFWLQIIQHFQEHWKNDLNQNKLGLKFEFNEI